MGHLNDFLKPFTKQNPASHGDYALSVDLVSSPDEADNGILPLSWSFIGGQTMTLPIVKKTGTRV